ncbi:DUF2911 domain-containing protein [Pseudotenacibaculum sp. MALMAid0570]|uniref:DUF2911 domain-containing protein n=1 Tax=Pseudotenacibaculum sp. MALMAid0570 TaxID=3143938 RepID=UPI0032E020C5
MKKTISLIAVLVVAVIFSNQIQAQEFEGLDKSPMDQVVYPISKRNTDKTVKITYSRPQLKGRSLAKLAPAGKVWRTGANEATEITFYKDVTVGGKQVKAGTYTMYAIPGDNEWTIIISKQLNVWGSYFYKESEDVARVKGKVSKSDKTLEAFSMAFGKDMTLYLGWGDTIVSVPMK